MILLAAVLSLLGLSLSPHASQQDFHIHVATVGMLTVLALLLWVLLLSRFRWRMRLLILAGFLTSLAVLAAMFRVRGVTGNLVPILEPRWAQRELSVPVAAPVPNAETAIPGGGDFPQFLGPARNGVLAGPKLATNWTASPPQPLWRQSVGAAWSGFAVSGPCAITQEQRGEEELVVCYDLVTGKPRWSHADRARYFTTLAGEGPRATPTISRGRVLTQGATGILNCLDLATGRRLWSKDVFREHQGSMPEWGQSSSPLVLDERVIVSAGGRPESGLVAYRLADGSVAWSAGRESASYSSPAVVTLDGLSQIVLFAGSLAGHDAATGAPLWKFRWPGGHPHVAQPVVAGDRDLILSSGYGTGSARVRLAREPDGKWTARQVWRTNRMKAKFANLILLRGHLYGLDDGVLACLDAETGALRWKDGKYGHGQLLLVGDVLLVMAESGEVVLVHPQPEQLRELTRFAALAGKTWNPPALAGEYLLVRNDREAACFRLPTAR